MNWTLIIIVAVIVLLILYVISTYNRFIKLKNLVEEAFATMDVYLKKRWDLIPNLVNTVKGYATHEKETLENVIGLRTGNYDDLTPEQKIEANKKLSSEISKLMMVVENYPDLKANQNFMDLSSQLQSVENDIANSRKYYNAVVRKYNNAIMVIPANIVASIFKFGPKSMFEIDEAERENVKVEF